MTLSEAARPVLLVGRLITVAASVLAFGLMAWRAYDLLHYAFLFEHPKWGDVGIYPFVTGLRSIVAVWVAWSVFRLGGDTLLHVQLMAFGGSFILLYGWHLLLIGMDDGFLYWVVAGDFLYLAGALAVGCDLFLEKVGPRPGTNQT